MFRIAMNGNAKYIVQRANYEEVICSSRLCFAGWHPVGDLVFDTRQEAQAHLDKLLNADVPLYINQE